VSITPRQAEEIAALARLRLEPDEAHRLARQLSTILDHMDELRQVDTDGVPAFAIAAQDAPLPRKDDVGTDPLLRPVADLAPAWQDGFFTVPRLAAQRGGDSDADSDSP
jgi:aspartyl-tRNA(Asn)/glutamyl-tRNA(Gln) amidotransferase subunit C